MDTLLEDYHSDMFLAANILTSQESLSYSQTLSREDTSTSNSQMLYDVTSCGGSSQGQKLALRRKPKYKSQKCVPTEGWETYRSPKAGQQQKRLVEWMATGSEGLVALARKRNQQSLRSKFRHLMLKKGQVLSESCLKKKKKKKKKKSLRGNAS